MTRSMTSGLAGPILALGNIHYLPAAKSGTFFARDNVSNFITWCRKSLKIIECLLFETDDLIMRKNEKHVILCLLEVARRGAKFGMLAPMLVQMERQIDREIAADIKANGANSSDSGTQTEAIASSSTISNMATSTTITTTTVGSETDLYDDSDDSENEDDADENPMLMYGPQPQIVTNDLKSLDEMVRDLVEKCTCPSQFPMVRVSEGKYRIGDTKVLIFVRILRSHVMVRVGGGWDTLAHYLDKHDPCRCRAQHRSSVAARLIPRQSPNHNPSNGIELHKAQVIFERSPTAARRVFNSPNCNGVGAGGATAATAATAVGMGIGLGAAQGQAQQNGNSLSPNSGKYRSRSPTPQRKFINGIQSNGIVAVSGSFTTAVVPEQQLLGSPGLARRSMSPSPRRLIDMRKKQSSLDSYSSGPKSLPGGCSCSLEDSGLGGGAVTAPSSGGVLGGGQSVPEQGNSSKFENISDNGSEISDEGYRSLGVNQSSAQKRESLHSQASMEDAETNARLDQTSSDSQISPTEEPPEKAATDILEEEDLNGQELDADADVDVEQDYSVCDGPQSLPAILRLPKMADKFEQSGVFITDDEITVDMAKSPHSPKLEMQQSPALLSKIPRSPLAQRRRSIDNSTSPFERSGKGRSSQILYDSNGRRVRGGCTSSLTTSPVKNHASSPLAQQLLEAASSAKNDAQILEKMKTLLSRYAASNQTSSGTVVVAGAGAGAGAVAGVGAVKTSSNGKKTPVYEDFTTAWVHSNGNLERSESCSPPAKARSKRSSAASSCESNHSTTVAGVGSGAGAGAVAASVVSPRRERGMSKIPAPVRHHTELY
ncbi:GL13342 [Drosophila persimilis]|uniref:GL13342 n=1 Tax=Drosophila persimilis TaxID=7234 RepID=B4H339_DROPE|nr:GL13342 [Drosophila persimilis]